ncbi:DUF5689 domain-containing protein [Pareuzebyella sediminis]|uniref:DUF5689 domain-containing protein n=1 Tax=Pareuzebyella sediminis TaxID=2607998 RepID=UPI0011ECC7E3|nr:DUF5689 domain-containing protein [Pareuzebyella sediminis]
MINSLHKFLFFTLTFFLGACVTDREYDLLKNECNMNLVANSTYAEVKMRFQGETVQILEDLIIEGYVTSSDKFGNFFNVLYFQNRPTNPTEGFQIELELRDSHLFYPVGSRILIKLKGLYLGKSKGQFKLGGTFTSFGNVSVGRLPAAVLDQHISVSCDESTAIEPTLITIEEVGKNLTNTLVRLARMEISEEELGQTYAVQGEETQRTLVDCEDREITLLNSGFSDFQEELLPNGSGAVVGVLIQEDDNFSLVVRSAQDLQFTNERCEDVIDEFTSRQIFISELADPDNNVGARFVELYNSASMPLSLKGWRLNRFTNEKTEVSSTIDLSGLNIAGLSTLVISPNGDEFENVYGFSPDLSVGTNSPADSNGDDNLELVDPFGETIDIFGIIGEDGTATNHEFEDGRAVRKTSVTEGSANYNFEEWTIYNDSGNLGTIDQPQNAPHDFSPGVRD